MRRFITLLLLACLSQAAAQSGGTRTDLAESLGSGAEAGFARAETPRRFRFPEDHGPHRDFRNEWWYVTGNVDSEDGARFGYELTFFRVALSPDAPDSTSNWRTNELWFAHLALSDVQADRFRFTERFARGAAGLAGASAQTFRVWLDGWSIEQRGDAWQLEADAGEFALDLRLESRKPPVLNGDNGLSQKSAAPGNASYYYALTRLATTGTVTSGDEVHNVSGLSWLDREWSTSALAASQQGWDWFALQLDDGTELMFYQLRQQDGSIDPHSAGTLTAADGTAQHIARSDLSLEVTDRWSSKLGGTYPAGWRLAVPEKGLELTVVPVMRDQELDTVVRYWEGAVDVTGTRDGMPLSGRGYVELTGYAR